MGIARVGSTPTVPTKEIMVKVKKSGWDRKEIQRKFGAGKLLTGDEAERLNFIPYGISTQSLCVDLAIGCPGIPGGRLTQITGLDGSGKSTLVQHIIAECQAMDGHVVLVDSEHTYDERRARKIGINTSEWDTLEPESLEECLDMVVEITKLFYAGRSELIGKTPLLFVLDSIEGLTPRDLLDAKAEDQNVSLPSRVINRNLSRILTVLAEYKAALITVSQMYTNIKRGGSFYSSDPEHIVKGGIGLRYRASLRLVVESRTSKSNRVFSQDNPEECIGFKNIIEVVKNKSNDPFKKGDYSLTFEGGIDKYADLLDACISMDLLEAKNGGWFEGVIIKKPVKFQKREWKNVVDSVYEGPDKLRRRLAKKAIQLGLMKPYGVKANGKSETAELEDD